MALSQIQCLDDNHVNPRTHESKPEFLYCENQRLALEALLQDGREAFFKYLEVRGLRGFLSDPELETLAGAVEPFDPGMDLFPDNAEDDEPPLSQHYWPEMSDTSIPQMDLGWPDTEAYRGVTRTTIYSQPPLDGQAHIKEVVRKMIAQAQKVIAVVMDVFTDVDIFRDLLDAGFKRRVSIYILLERTALPHFLSMCQRANMHAGHLKHLRVRYTDGLEFHTRSSLKVRGRMGHRFMFIDGDKAVSGSYSFTWMSSRLERSLITVITGQAVDAFDRLFRILYASSSWADLRRVAMEPEPEPERLPQVASVAPPSAAVARKLYNPKYALALGNPSPSPSLTPSDGHNSPKKTQSPENSRNADTKKGRRRRPSQEAVQEAPPIHPGLVDLEKACLMAYLPTWPEPDPPSDVIGFINIRDTSKPIQVHLQRSEMFGTSQAIKFSSPISMPKETLPEVAKPRQLTTKHEEVNKLQPAQVKTKAETSVADRTQPTQLNARPDDIKSKAEAPEQNSPAPGPKCESDKDTAKTLNAGDKLHLKTPTNQDAAILHLNKHAPPESSGKASIPDAVRPSHTTQAVTANKPKPDSLPGSNTKEAEASLNTQNDVVYRTHTPESNSPSDSNAEQRTQTKTVMPHTDSHTQVVHTQPQKSAEFTSNNQTINIKSHTSPSSTSTTCTSTSFSENNHVSITTGMTTSDCALNPPLPSSSASSTPPMPKPRTIQLVIKDGVAGDGQKLPEVSVVRRPQTSTGLLVVHDEPAAATVAQTSPEKEPETVPELQNNKGSKTGAQKDAANTGNIGEASQQKQSGTSQETKNEEAVGLHHDRAGMQLVTGNNLDAQSDVLITDAPKAESVNIQEIIPKDVESKTLTSIGCKSIDCAATVEAGTKAPERALTGCEFAEVPKEDSKNVTQPKAHHAYTHELQTTLYYVLTPQDKDILEDVGSKAPSHAPVSPTDIADDSTHTFAADTHGQPGEPSFTPAQSMPDTVKHSTSSIFEELIPEVGGSTNAPEKPLCLLLSDVHKPDLHSLSPERESQSPAAPVRHPPSDEFLPRTPTPDSQTRTPDPQSCTPDFQMPPPKNTGNIGGASQRKHSVTSQQTKNEEAVGLHHDRAGMQLVTGNKLDAQSDVLITDAPKAESVNIQEIIPKDVEPKTLTSIGCKLTPQIDSVATVGAGSKAPERALTGCEFALVPNANSKNVTQPKTYHAYTHEHQRISYGEFTPTHTPVSPTRNLHMSKDTAHDSTHTSAADTQGQQGNPSFSPAQSIPDTVKQSTSSAFQELIPQAGGSTNTPEKPLPLPLSDMPKADVCLLSPEKELRSLMVLVRTPTPDGFLPSTPTPASRTHTPDPRSHTPDFRTPTPEISDGYVSPRPDSVLSTTSEEYYECSDSPFHEPVLCFTHTNTTNSTSVATSPINYKSLAAVLGTTDKNSSCSETQSLSRPDSVSSLSSLPEKKAKMEEEEKEETANEKHGRKVDKKGKKLSVAERRTEGDSQGTQRRGSVEAKRTVDHSKQCKDSTETVEKNKEAQPQTPKRKRVSSQSAAERLVDGGVTSGLTNEGAEPKQLSTGDLKPKKLSSEGERPDKDKAVDRAALGPSSVERRGRAHARETEGAKLLHTPPRPLRGQQQDSRVASPSRPSRSPRSRSASQSSGARSWGSRHLSQTESKMLHSGVQVLDNSSSSRRLPSRPPPPILTGAVRSAAGRRQAEVSQSLLSRQPLAAQGRARGGCSQEAQGQEEGKSPFSFTFSRLYSLRGMRDKVGRLPSQGKRDSSSPPVQGRKSTS